MFSRRFILALILVLAAAQMVLLPVLGLRYLRQASNEALRNLAYARAGSLEVGLNRAVEACRALLGPAAAGSLGQGPFENGPDRASLQCPRDPALPLEGRLSFKVQDQQTRLLLQLPGPGHCSLQCDYPLAGLPEKPLRETRLGGRILVDEDGLLLEHPDPRLLGTLADRTLSEREFQALLRLRAKASAEVWTSHGSGGQNLLAASAVVRLPLDSGFLGLVSLVSQEDRDTGRGLLLLELALLTVLILLGGLVFRFHRRDARSLRGDGEDWDCPRVLAELPSPVLMGDAEGRVLFANQEARLLLGLGDSDEQLPAELAQILDPPDLERLQHVLRTNEAGSPPQRLTLWVLCADGRRRKTQANLRIVKLQDGRPGVLAQLQLEEETASSVNAFTAGFSKARVGLVLLDGHFKVRLANQEMARLLGLGEPEVLVGQAFYQAAWAGPSGLDGGASREAVDSVQPRFFGPVVGPDGQRYAGWAVPLACGQGIPECVITSFMNVEGLAQNLEAMEDRQRQLAAGLMAAGVETWSKGGQGAETVVCRAFPSGDGQALDCRTVGEWSDLAGVARQELARAIAQAAGQKQFEMVLPRAALGGSDRLLLRGARLDDGSLAGVTMGLEGLLSELDGLREGTLFQGLALTLAGVPGFVADLGLERLRLSPEAAQILGLQPGLDGLWLEDAGVLLGALEPSSRDRVERALAEGRAKGSRLETWFQLRKELGGGVWALRGVVAQAEGSGEPKLVAVFLPKNSL